MPVKQATPGGGGGSRTDSFSYERTPPDQPWFGWLAGPPSWIKGHLSRDGPTKICVRWATDGAIHCQRCTPKSKIDDVGYVPVYRESDGASILVIVYDTSYDFLAHVKPLDYVRVVREGAETERVTVQRALTKKPYKTSLKRRQVAVDISDQLVRLWGISEYTEWYSVQPGNTAVPLQPVRAPAAPVAADLAAGIGVPIDATETDVLAAERDRLARLQRNYERGKDEQKRISNGKHNPKS
jgi:hypothetical protein